MKESNFNEDPKDETNTNEITSKIEYGFFSGPGVFNQLVPFREFEGEAIAEGDIVLGSVEELRNPDPKILEQNEEERIKEAKRKGLAMGDTKYRWPNQTMPYEIDPNFHNPSLVTNALEHITSKTGFKFVKRTNEADYVVYKSHPTVSKSRLGRVGRRQEIWYGVNFPPGSLIHETCHALGIYHETGRPNRDNYIKIHFTNLMDGWAAEYNQPVGALSIASYDYCSIMHYPTTGGAKAGTKAFTVLHETTCTVGQRDGLSPKDIQTIKRIYKIT